MSDQKLIDESRRSWKDDVRKMNDRLDALPRRSPDRIVEVYCDVDPYDEGRDETLPFVTVSTIFDPGSTNGDPFLDITVRGDLIKLDIIGDDGPIPFIVPIERLRAALDLAEKVRQDCARTDIDWNEIERTGPMTIEEYKAEVP